SVTTSSSSYTGMAPTLTSTYAEYDNGSYVFTNYWNFSGTTLPSGWTLSAGSYSVNNGISLNLNAAPAYFYYSSTSISYPIIMEYYGYVTTGSGKYLEMLIGQYGTNGETGFGIGNPSGAYNFVYMNGGTGNTLSSTWNTNTNYLVSVWFPSSTEMLGYVNYNNILSETSVTADSPYITIFGNTGGNYYDYIYYIRTRQYPPNNTMPSITFGSVQ
ncbi:MAG: hypothetical protein ACP5U0_10470, partial [Caldisphaera sp.]